MHDVTLDFHLWLTMEVGDCACLERWLVLESIEVVAGERFVRGAVLARLIPL
ncbi:MULTISPECIES: hypothetical protein [unclassified Hydrogenophaga]|uniref:hypothetical protein n=1 Tax=unclassified Hydrogenophaga TaxID=2610897 RepID=UPI0012E354D2|nr:hypothetical protein [Hydrogenophaga sp. Root209]